MRDTLAALHAAIIDAPTDRTVRLVYADALDESGDPAHAARAKFIRAQIRLEAVPATDPERAGLVAQCSDSFAEHWIDWWRPVCAAVGLPEPFVPKQRFRDRVKRASCGASGAATGAPYAVYLNENDYGSVCSIHSSGHAFTAQFIAGFPELLYFRPYLAEPERLARWVTAIPLARLRFGHFLNDESEQIVDGPYLVKVSELTFDRLSIRAAALAAHSPHLKALAALRVYPAHPVVDVVRTLVHDPTWTGLRSLTFSGITSPDAIQAIAECCTLMELEELSFGIAQMRRDEMQMTTMVPFPETPGPIRWPDYWPALEALTRAPIFSRLRKLRVSDPRLPADAANESLRRFMLDTHFRAFEPDSIFPDVLVRALADGLNADRLVRLELPAARLAPESWAELSNRFGPRFVPV